MAKLFKIPLRWRLMSKIIILLLLSTISLLVTAKEDESRKSYIGFNLDYSENHYRNYALGGAWGINSVWQIGAGGSRSNDQDSNRYQTGFIFASGRWNDYFDNKLTLFTSEEQPEALIGNGAEIKSTVKYPILQEGFYTTLSLALGNTHYQQEAMQTRTLGTSTAIKDFVQRYIVMDMSQDLLEWLLFGLALTKYSYQDASETSFVGRNQRYAESTSIDGSSDYPDKKSELYLSVFYKQFVFDLAVAKTSSKLQNNDSVNKSINLNYEYSDQFYPTIGISSIQYDDQSTNNTLSLGMDFVF